MALHGQMDDATAMAQHAHKRMKLVEDGSNEITVALGVIESARKVIRSAHELRTTTNSCQMNFMVANLDKESQMLADAGLDMLLDSRKKIKDALGKADVMDDTTRKETGPIASLEERAEADKQASNGPVEPSDSHKTQIEAVLKTSVADPTATPKRVLVSSPKPKPKMATPQNIAKETPTGAVKANSNPLSQVTSISTYTISESGTLNPSLASLGKVGDNIEDDGDEDEDEDEDDGALFYKETSSASSKGPQAPPPAPADSNTQHRRKNARSADDRCGSCHKLLGLGRRSQVKSDKNGPLCIRCGKHRKLDFIIDAAPRKLDRPIADIGGQEKAAEEKFRVSDSPSLEQDLSPQALDFQSPVDRISDEQLQATLTRGIVGLRVRNHFQSRRRSEQGVS